MLIVIEKMSPYRGNFTLTSKTQSTKFIFFGSTDNVTTLNDLLIPNCFQQGIPINSFLLKIFLTIETIPNNANLTYFIF